MNENELNVYADTLMRKISEGIVKLNEIDIADESFGRIIYHISAASEVVARIYTSNVNETVEETLEKGEKENVDN